MTRQMQFLIGGIIIAAILIGVAYQSFETTVFFYTPKEILAEPTEFEGRKIRIGALVEQGSTEWDAQRVELKFRVTDDNQHFIPVVFAGVKPDMYREGQGVVVEGRLENGSLFRANTVLVKHSEDYTVAPDHAVNKEAAMKTLAQ